MAYSRVHANVREYDVWSIQLPDNEPGFEHLATFSNGKPDGCIARIVDRRMARKLKSLHIPVVDVAGGRDLSIGCWVATNHARVVQMGIEHFQRRGFRRVAFCGDARFDWSNLRQKLFRDIAKGAPGIGFDLHRKFNRLRINLAIASRFLRDLPVDPAIQVFNHSDFNSLRLVIS